ncbi:hypothetical protein C5167_019073 [Papaver somniferum]|uniref:Uncharacterized protein n=1 Tax=Papaver somniferum TaxID=3469 RepID=A0A4Y7ISH3_PAPSO|nr:transcription factor MYB101-like [Papaver somniferum]RZC50652.1 hypothetical protein C5167_019073 [Papaver somniferum]
MMNKHKSINENGVLGRREDFSPDHHGGGGEGGGGSGLKKGPWTAGEDAILTEYVKRHGEGNWNAVQKNSGLARCGKSCRLRWANHLRPNLKKGSFSPEEEHLILELHSKLGNKWARMAAQLPGRTDNEIKNYWNTRVKRRQRAGLPLYPENLQRQSSSSLSFQLPNQNQSNDLQFSSFQQQKPSFNSSPFTLFNLANTTISTPPFASQFHEYKRYRSANSNYGYSLPFSSNDHAQLPSSLFSQNHSSQLQSSSNVEGYHFGNFELNPSTQIQRNSFEPDELGGSSSDFSLKLELPSIQLPDGAVANAANSGSVAEGCNLSSQSYLLDALLQQAQTMANGDNGKRAEKRYGFDQFAQDAPTSESVFKMNGSNPSASQGSFGAGMKLKEEPKEVINSGDDDLSSLLDIVPPPMHIGEWGYSDNSGEISNGPSSGVTEDDVGGLDQMKQLSTTSMPNTNSDSEYWNDTWNNMPGIC